MNKKNSRNKARKPPKKAHKTKKVKIIGTNEKLTSQAGLIPPLKFLLDKLGLEQLIKQTITHTRIGANAVYHFPQAMILVIIGLIGGATAMTGIVAVWSDGVLAQIANFSSIPDNSNLGRIFKTVKEAHINQMETLVHKARTHVWKRAFRSGTSTIMAKLCLTLDGDSTVKTVYGHQEGAETGYNPHKRGALSYHPLLVFCSNTKEILQGWFRCGTAYTSNGIVEFMKQLLAHLPNKIHIFFRGDSGFFSGEFLSFLENSGHSYLIKVKLKNLKKLLAGQVWTTIKKHPEWEQGVFWYKCGSWKHERRFIAVRILKEELQSEKLEYDYFCYVTTEELTPWEAHKEYGKRATCETWIDEAKNQMGLAHIKTDSFLANAALFQCAILAYNTVRWMALLSGDVALRRWEMGTVRAFLVRVAGKLISGSRQLILKTPDSHMFIKQWLAWVKVGLT